MQALEISNMTVAEIVRSDYRTAEVFKQFGINYCCAGKVTLEEACLIKEIDYKTVENKLCDVTRNIYVNNSMQFYNWKIDFLIDYIINVHHTYLDETLPALVAAMISFIEGHKKKFPELDKIFDAFTELSHILLSQNKHEEEVLFPYIKQLDSTFRGKESYGSLFVRTMRKPLDKIEKEGERVIESLRKLELYTNSFVPPENACTNHQVIYHKIHEIYNDLIQHKHLERNILFPKAIEIEQRLLQL